MRRGFVYAIRSVHGVLLREALREIEVGPPPVFFLVRSESCLLDQFLCPVRMLILL